jgi:hypothetical protein
VSRFFRIVLLLVVTALLAGPLHAAAPADAPCPSQRTVEACIDVGRVATGLPVSADGSCASHAVMASSADVFIETGMRVRPHMPDSSALEDAASGGIERPPKTIV